MRTPLGRRNGMLAGWHPVDLAAHTLRTLVERNDLDPALVDDVIMGCVCRSATQALNIGRNAALAAGFPDTVPGTSIDRQCGSSQQALHFAAQGVIAGAYDVVIAAGIESMSPGADGLVGAPGADPFGPALHARYPGLVPQGMSAELIAERWGLTREELDAFALESHRKAAARRRRRRGSSARSCRCRSPSTEHPETLLLVDEGIRPDTSPERLAALKPAFKPDGVVTAGNSSQITDGAAAVLVTSEEAAGRLGLRPAGPVRRVRARRRRSRSSCSPPRSRRRRRCSSGRKRRLDDIDLIEINEAFASVVLAWEREVHPDPDGST